MPKRARDEDWVGKTVMLTPHAASGKRLPEAAILKVVSVSVSAKSASFTLEYSDDEGFGYAKTIQTVLVPSAAPSIPRLKMWQPSGDLARDFEENARQRKCFLKEAELKQLAGEVGVPTAGLKRDQIIDALSAWASTACLSHMDAQLRSE